MERENINVERESIIEMQDFYSILYQKYGVISPDKFDQDWRFTAGDSENTENYIDFYHKNILSVHQKKEMMNMIIQGFDDLIAEGRESVLLEQIWNKIKTILVAEKQLYYQDIIYWSCLDTELEEDRFYVSKYMRELL